MTALSLWMVMWAAGGTFGTGYCVFQSCPAPDHVDGPLPYFEVDVPAIQETRFYREILPLTKAEKARVRELPERKANKQECDPFGCRMGEFTTYICPLGYARLNEWRGVIGSSIPDGEATITDVLDKEQVPLCQNVSDWKAIPRRYSYVKYEIGKSCADKSRILLTDESGGKHCVKFSEGK